MRKGEEVGPGVKPGSPAKVRAAERSDQKIVLAGDRQTLNVLMLELATMVVAIALALSANFLTVFSLDALVAFVFTTATVIWFWWDYIRDRLLYPPATSNFPYLDVLVLILISLIPFALRQNNISYVSGVLSVLLIVWALMISRIMSEHENSVDVGTMNHLRTEVVQRASVGLLLVAGAVLGAYTNLLGILVLSLLVTIVITWNFAARRRRRSGGSGDIGDTGEPQVAPLSA